MPLVKGKQVPLRTAVRLSLTIELARDKGNSGGGALQDWSAANGGNNVGGESTEKSETMRAATRQNLGVTRRTEIGDL